MSRMISVDGLVHGLSADYMTGRKTLLQVIDEQPTAFDRYAVIEQLKEKSRYARIVGEDKPCELLKLAEVIEIVEGGGGRYDCEDETRKQRHMINSARTMSLKRE